MAPIGDQWLIEYAREQADRIERGMQWRTGQMGAFWQAIERSEVDKIVAEAMAGMEFLRTWAGPDSLWLRRAEEEIQSMGQRQSLETGCRAVAPLLRGWADQVERGVLVIERSEQANAVQLVSTDLMSQVRVLNEDRTMSPVAAIVLAGASLEIALRRIAETKGLTLDGRPSISAWGGLLRRNNFISVQEMKEIEQVGGLRNSAAHGQLDELSLERSGLMEQQVNLLLTRLEDRLTGTESPQTT